MRYRQDQPDDRRPEDDNVISVNNLENSNINMLETANLRYHVANPTNLHYPTPSTIICIASATQFIQLSSPNLRILYISGYSYARDCAMAPQDKLTKGHGGVWCTYDCAINCSGFWYILNSYVSSTSRSKNYSKAYTSQLHGCRLQPSLSHSPNASLKTNSMNIEQRTIQT